MISICRTAFALGQCFLWVSDLPSQEHPGTHRTQIPAYILDWISPFSAVPDSMKVASLLTQWNAAGGPVDIDEKVVAAALWRRAGQVDLALASLEPAEDVRGSPVASVEMARILFAAAYYSGKRSQPDPNRLAHEAGEWFWSACRMGDAGVLREIWVDLRGLATPGEQEDWRDGAGPGCEWIRRFVGERAWRSATDLDARLASHYERLIHVRRTYGLRKPRFARTAFTYEQGRPDSLEFDDRGLVYLRLGAPERIEYASTAAGITEHWAYARPDGYWLYYFVPGSPTHDYRMAESLGPLARPGNDFFQRYVTRSALDPLAVKRQVFHLERLSFGREPWAERLGSAELRALRLQERNLARSFGRRAVSAIPDGPDVKPAVRLLTEALSFANPGTGRASVWILAAARAGDLRAHTVEGATSYRILGSVAFLADTGVVLAEAEHDLAVTGKLPEDAGVSLRIPLALPPGTHEYTVAVRDGNADDERSGNWLQDSVVVPRFQPFPHLSDIAVASDSGSAWTRDGRTHLAVTPAHVVNADGSLHIYFEAYGMSPGATYDVDLRLVSEEEADRVYQLPSRDAAFRLEYEATMPETPSPIGVNHLRLALGATEPGIYVLAIRVRDDQTSRTSLPSTTWIHKP